MVLSIKKCITAIMLAREFCIDYDNLVITVIWQLLGYIP